MYDISGLVIVTYCKAPTVLLYMVGLSIGSPFDLESTFLEIAGVGKGFATTIFVF